MSGRKKTYDMVQIAVFAVLIAVCSWISIPTVVPFTLQTFAVFLTLGICGGKKGTLAVLVYILLGAVGVPVFAGFSGGISVLFGQTGGYIIGFLGTALLTWGLEKVLGNKKWAFAVEMLLGTLVCYAFGTIWFMIIYSGTNGAVSLITVLSWCVIPFIIPDLIKMGLAFILRDRLSLIIKNME